MWLTICVNRYPPKNGPVRKDLKRTWWFFYANFDWLENSHLIGYNIALLLTILKQLSIEWGISFLKQSNQIWLRICFYVQDMFQTCVRKKRVVRVLTFRSSTICQKDISARNNFFSSTFILFLVLKLYTLKWWEQFHS